MAENEASSTCLRSSDFKQNTIVIAKENISEEHTDHISCYRGEVILLVEEITHGEWAGHWRAKTETANGLLDTSRVTNINFSKLKEDRIFYTLDWLPYFLSGTFFIFLNEHESRFVYNNYGTKLEARLDLAGSNNEHEINERIQEFIWRNRNIFRFYIDDDSAVNCNQFLTNNRHVLRRGNVFPYIPDWYHGYIGKVKSNKMLDRQPKGTFLVGKDRLQCRYVLSITDGQNIHHIQILETKGKVLFGNTLKKYDSVADLIEVCFSLPLFIEQDGKTTELTLKRWISCHDRGLPGGFSTQDPYWTELYLQTLLDGKEKHMSVRLMLIGHEGVGKTTLSRNLMDRSIEDVETTNGIEVHVKTCAVDKTGKWKESETKDRDSKMIERIARIVQPGTIADKESDKVNDIDQTTSLKASDGLHSLSLNSTSEKSQLQTTAKNDDNVRLPVENEAGGPNSVPNNNPNKLYPLYLSETPVTNENARKVIHVVLGNTESLLDKTVSIWDFGGQFIFYATHQLFHSPRAVYLLVIDLSKRFQDMIDYGNPLSYNTNDQRNVESFIKFWMHSIHAFASSDSGEPPVILVGTFRDKIGGEERSKDEYAEKYFDDIRALFDGTSLVHHIQPEQYFLDNLEPDTASLVHLKNSIMAIAERQSSWNQEIPAKWILLEQALNQIKDGPYITFSKVCEMDSKIDVPITNVDEIRLFLMFHHFTGDFVYFNEDELMNYVILNPQWIIDAFKSIITSKRFCKVRSHLRGIWHEFETTAVLKDELIDEVWNNDDQNDFHSERYLILKYLVRLGIMSRVKVFHEDSEKVEELDYYLVPSILPMKEDTYFIDNLFSKATSTAVVAVIKLENSYISPTIYHRVTAAALGKWAVVESCGSRLLYGNMGMYRLDMQHVGMAKLTDKTLELSVYNLCGNLINNEKADAYRRFISNVIKHELNKFHAGKETLFMTMFRCNCSSTHTHQHITLDELQGHDSIPCLMTVPAHNIDAIQAYNEWFIEVDILVQRQPVTSGRTLGEKELGHISKSIGLNWKLLGISLGIPQAQLERIQMDHPHSSLVQIKHMLLTWKQMAGESATLETLVREMRENPAVTIDWDTIKDAFDVFETEVKTVY